MVEGHEVVDAGQDAHGVTVAARDIDTGEARVAGPLPGRRGRCAQHPARAVQIPFDGRGVFSNSITIYFTADLRPQMAGKALSVIYINNETFGGFFRLDKRCQSGFLVVNTVGDQVADPAAPTPPPTRARSGWSSWYVSARACPTSLCGSTASPAGEPLLTSPAATRMGGSSSPATRPTSCHRTAASAATPASMTPTTSRGSSPTSCRARRPGAARHLRGRAPPCRPVHRRAGLHPLRTRTAPHLGVDGHQPLAPDFDVELGYLYRSPASRSADGDDVVSTPIHARPAAAPAPVRHTSGSTATARGSRCSTSRPPLRPPHRRGRGGVARRRRRHGRRAPGLELEVHRVGGADLPTEGASFDERYGVSETGAVLVRPDGFVAWRARSDSAAEQAALGPACRRARPRLRRNPPAPRTLRPPEPVLAVFRVVYGHETPRERAWGGGVRGATVEGSPDHSAKSRPSNSASSRLGAANRSCNRRRSDAETSGASIIRWGEWTWKSAGSHGSSPTKACSG